MREETASRVMAADRPYGEFYDIYSVSPEYLEYNAPMFIFGVTKPVCHITSCTEIAQAMWKMKVETP
jgi:hypothetical protein